MDFNDFTTSLQQAFAPQLLNILGAIGILVVGWLLAVMVRAVVRRGLAVLKVDARAGSAVGDVFSIERPVSLAAFWLIILMTIVAVLSVLRLTDVAAPIQGLITQVTAYLPRIFAAVVLFVVAWLIATVCKAVVTRLLRATALDDKLSASAGMPPMSGHAGTTLFWLVMLLFLPAIVGTLGISGLVTPLEGLTNQFLGMLPNIFAALVIGGVGWLLARVLRGFVTGAVGALGVDKHAGVLGAASEHDNPISRAAGTVVFVLVLVPAIVAALDALQIAAISQPAGAMLSQFLAAIPNIVAAVVILGVAWIVARLVAGLVTRVTAAAGVDGWPQKLGVQSQVVTTGTATDAMQPSKVLGSLVLFFIMLFAATEAANQLALGRFADMLANFIQFAGDILLGAVILVVGWWLAGLAANAIRQSSDRHGGLLAQIARFAIIGLVLGMGLRAMGVADDIVNLGFGLTLGAVAVAVALAFGLGGREAAARLLDRWLKRIDS